ncbi:MAG TPA: type I DNA topoisomerase [Syntrophorhabdales bacterium]|nr:type I DNA topoisomerase [Syntrophorhabdales bacterium]
MAKSSAKSLLIVESPTKVKTLSKFLGKEFTIKATYGHIKDLPKSKMGVDVDDSFKPHFGLIKGKSKVVDTLKKASAEADRIYIGSDPDREGEAIAFHVAEVVGKKKPVKRVLFNEITKKAVVEAIKSPQDLDESKYEAQKTRRILDRLVGYQISPLLWERVKYGLSAGRVQSVALKLVCERQDEIDAFVKEEYWSIEGLFTLASGETFEAKLEKIGDEKIKIPSKQEADRFKAEAASKSYTITGIEEKERAIMPQPVFKTSSLQQEASRKLRFSPSKTMLIAQKLYEGVDLGEGTTTGLITYMRTDSVRVSHEALGEVRKLIGSQFGPGYVPEKPNFFKNNRAAQDAHEGIRPSDVTLDPERVKPFLEKDLFMLYDLIWKRFVASQMARLRLQLKSVDVAGGDYLFVARGSTILFDGYTKLYEEDKSEDEESRILPEMREGEAVSLTNLSGRQHFTNPPPYFTEASLIKTLEAKGIGRPSTYAATVGTIQEREYVRRDRGRLMVTPLGRTVNSLLTHSFPRIVDYDFTAKMEEGLDQIEEKEKDWIAELNEFYSVFKEEMSAAKKEMKNLKKEERPTDIICDKCGKPMVLRWGRNGEYLVCTGRPECKNKKNVEVDKDGKISVVEETFHGVCPNCGGNLVEKTGRFGRFIACSTYPNCKFTKSMSLGFQCPLEGCTGELVERVSKKKRKFYGCSRYPECTFTTSSTPKAGECPSCGAPVVFGSRGSTFCLRKDCGWKSRS